MNQLFETGGAVVWAHSVVIKTREKEIKLINE